MATDVNTFEVLGHDHLFCYEIVKAIKDRYVLYKKKYIKIQDPENMSWLDKLHHKSATATEPHLLEDSFLLDHLHGDYAVGVFAGPHATKFICIDIDIHEPEVVHKTVDTLEQMGFPRDRIYVSLSGGKGYHVEIFVKNFIWNNKAKLIYKQMLELSGLDRKKVEFWPTYTHGVKLPLGIHQKTKQRCWFVDRETLEPIERLEYIFETEFVDQAFVEEIADRYFRQKMTEAYAELEEQRLQSKTRGGSGWSAYPGFDVTVSGTRHIMQMKYAIWRRQCGANRSQLYYDQIEWYRRQNQNLISTDEDEISRDANGIADWCIRNVVVLNEERIAKEAPVARITQQDLIYILKAKTPAYRKVAFFIWLYCRRYGSTKIAYRTIAQRTGMSRDRVVDAINWMCDEYSLGRESSKKDKNNYYIKESNTYTLPDVLDMAVIPKRYRKAEYVETTEHVTDKSFMGVYASVLTRLCTNSYLKKIMKPKEYEELMNAEDTATDS